MAIYGEPVYGDRSDNTDFFLSTLVESLPPNYRPEEYRDFLERFLLPSAEDLSRVNETFDRLDTFVYPESAPEDWIDWWLTEVMGWSLIPDGYPLARKRRLLADLLGVPGFPYKHYKKRYTTVGIKELLREFGVVANVYDRPIYAGGYLSDYGVTSPLNVWVRVLYYEPWESPQNNYVGSYMGAYAYRTHSIITNEFVAALCEWERAAGVRMIVEYVTASNRPRALVSLYDVDTEIEIEQPTTQEQNITE
jgi:hypothetical protein